LTYFIVTTSRLTAGIARPSYFYTAHPRAPFLIYHFTVYCGFHPPLLNLHGLPESVILIYTTSRLTADFIRPPSPLLLLHDPPDGFILTYYSTAYCGGDCTHPSYFYTAYPARASLLIYYFTAHCFYTAYSRMSPSFLTYYFTAYCDFYPPLLLLHGPPEGFIFDLLLHGFLRFSPAPPKSTRPTRERHLDLYPVQSGGDLGAKYV